MRKRQPAFSTYVPVPVILLLALFPFLAFGDIITVGPSGDYTEIQDAVDAAKDGDEIVVSPGRYVPRLGQFWVVRFLGKNITVRSTAPTDREVVEKTILDAQMKTRVILFNGKEGTTCTLTGFTITGGITDKGGGIYGNGTLATITNNNITTNGIYLNPIQEKNYGAGIMDCDGLLKNNLIANNDQGGGVADCDGVITGNVIERNNMKQQNMSGGGLYNCNGEIRHNVIQNNAATGHSYGGGGLAYCNAIISSNDIINNTSGYDGGGLFHCGGTIEKNLVSENGAVRLGGGFSYCSGTIQNNIVTSNTASYYGGGFYNCSGKVRNNTVFANQAMHGGGFSSSSGITNCIIWGNTGGQLDKCGNPTYSCIQGGIAGQGNISDDPKFVAPAKGDFHLMEDSPCIDAGAFQEGLREDFEGNPRPYDAVAEPRGDGSNFDIGAYEYFPAITLETIRDHILARLIIPQSRLPEADKNEDAVINVADIVHIILHKK